MQPTLTAAANATATAQGLNPRKLFVLCCAALATTSMSFILRADITTSVQAQIIDPIDKLHSAAILGEVFGIAFLGFAFTVAIGSALVDWIGMRNLLALCGLSFIAGAGLTVGAESLATGPAVITVLKLGMFLNGLGWGCSETVINPLTTAIYPDEKTHRLNVLHAWWPGGMIIGGVLALLGNRLAWSWQAKFSLLLIPALLVLGLCVGTKFPKTERAAAGVPASEMFKQSIRPAFLIWFFMMFLTSAAELAPSAWVDVALTRTVGMQGIILLIYVAGLMFVMRHFAGALVHRLSSVGLLWVSCLLAALGLVALSFANSPVTGLLGATVWGVGVCYMWPTMLAAAAERFPKGGAFLMGLIGTAGALSIKFVLPLMGELLDKTKIEKAGGEAAYNALAGAAKDAVDIYAATVSFRVVAILPAVLLLAFGAIWLRDRARGGFKPETLAQPSAAQPNAVQPNVVQP